MGRALLGWVVTFDDLPHRSNRKLASGLSNELALLFSGPKNDAITFQRQVDPALIWEALVKLAFNVLLY